jgi:hypothetical protein
LATLYFTVSFSLSPFLSISCFDDHRRLHTLIICVELHRVTISMALFLSVIFVLLILFIAYYLVPILVRHVKLRRDYRTIPTLPISLIPFVGNLHQFDKRQYVFSRLLLQMAKECQQQDKGIFCLWYSLRPMIFLCTGRSLEVSVHSTFLLF